MSLILRIFPKIYAPLLLHLQEFKIPCTRVLKAIFASTDQPERKTHANCVEDVEFMLNVIFRQIPLSGFRDAGSKKFISQSEAIPSVFVDR